jgi:hypothetical protein
MHILFIDSPPVTKAGKPAVKRKYRVVSVVGTVARTIGLGQLCKEESISFAGMLRHLRKFKDGQYESSFRELIYKMKVARTGKRSSAPDPVCPYCFNLGAGKMRSIAMDRPLPTHHMVQAVQSQAVNGVLERWYKQSHDRPEL